MLKRLRVIAILLCGVIFLNGLCIGSASAGYTPPQLKDPNEQSIVDKIEDDRHDQKKFGSIIKDIGQYYQIKDSDGKSGYSKEFNEYCLSVLFKLYHEILKTDSLQKEFLSPQSKGSKEVIPNIKEVIPTGVRVLGDLNDTTNLSYPTLLYRVLNLELDKNRNKSISQRLDSDISQHMETILRRGKELLCTTSFRWRNFKKKSLITQLNFLRCVGICGENVELLLSDEELHKISQQISGLSLEEYQKDLREMKGPTTSSSSSSFSNENSIKYTKNLEVKILIQFARIQGVDLKKQISALEAVIEYFFRLATPSSSSSKPSNDKMYQIAAKDAQGREALIQLGRIPHDDGKEEVSALNAVINYFFRLATQSSSSSKPSNDKMYQIAAKDAQGREALIALGRIPHDDGKEEVSALNAVINYFGNIEVAAREVQGREALIALGRIPHDDGKEQVRALNAVINYFGNIEVAANYEQGRKALIALGQVKHDNAKEIGALEAVIEYFFNKASSHKLSSSSSSSSSPTSVDEKEKYEIAAKDAQGREALIALGRIPQYSYNKRIIALGAVIEHFGNFEIAAKDAQGREALIALGKIPHDDGKEEVSALNAVINYFGNIEVAANYEQGRKALIALGQVKHDNAKEIGALEAVIEYFFNKASSHKLSSSSSSSSSPTSVDEKEKYEIAAKDAQGREALIALGRIPQYSYNKRIIALGAVIEHFGNFEIAAKDAQGREALIQLGRIPHDDGKEEVSALNAVINYFGNVEVAANYEQGREALLQWCRIPENNNSKKVAILKILKKKNYKLADVCRIANNIFNSLRYEEGDFYYDLRGRLNIILGRSYGFDNSILVGNSTSSSLSQPSSTSFRTNSISPNSFGQSSIKSSYLNSDVISNSPSPVSSNSPSSPSTTFYYQGKGGGNSLSPPPQSHFSSPPSSNSSSPAISTSSSGSSSSDSDQISKVPFSFSDLPNTSKENSKPSSSVPSSTSSSPPPSFSTSSLLSGGIMSNSHSLSLPPSSSNSSSPEIPASSNGSLSSEKNSKSSSPSSSSLPSVSSSNSSSPEIPTSSNGSSFSLRSKISSLKLSSPCPRFYPKDMRGVNNDQSQQQLKNDYNSLTLKISSSLPSASSSNSSSPAISTSSSGSSFSLRSKISSLKLSSPCPRFYPRDMRGVNNDQSQQQLKNDYNSLTLKISSSLPSGGIVSNNHSLSLPPSNTSGNSTQGTSHNSLSKNPGKDINSSSPLSSSSSNSKTQEYLKKFIDNLVNEFFKKLNAKYQAKQRKVTAVVEEGIVQKGQTT